VKGWPLKGFQREIGPKVQSVKLPVDLEATVDDNNVDDEEEDEE
jgi:hypothetical protein